MVYSPGTGPKRDAQSSGCMIPRPMILWMRRSHGVDPTGIILYNILAMSASDISHKGSEQVIQRE